MGEFSQNYYNLKRTVLIFAALTLLFCVPGAHVDRLSFAGIDLSGVSFELLVFLMAAAATYYATLFGMTAYVEAKSNLIARDRNEEDIKATLERSLARVNAAVDGLGPLLQSSANKFDETDLRKRFDEIGRLLDDGKVVLAKPPILYQTGAVTEDSSELFNLLSSHVARTEKKYGEARTLKLHELKDSALDALKADIPVLVTTAVTEMSRAAWRNLERSLEKATSAMEEFASEFRALLREHESALLAYREAISRALFEIKVLKTVRTARFWIFEVGVVSAVYLIATAHYVGRFFVWFPSVFG
jgi:hypothetical protein